MTEIGLPAETMIRYLDPDRKRYSVWVYVGDDIPQVYLEEKPNTREVWFEFNAFSLSYWRMMEGECVEENDGTYFYNNKKIYLFMISRMLHATSLPWIRIERKSDGTLTKETMDVVMSLHPRILTGIMSQIVVVSRLMTKKEEKEFDKQCMRMFLKGEAITNPNKWIVIYNLLKSFWDKLGINYEALMRLPYETYQGLHKVMVAENNYQMQSLNTPTQHQSPRPRRR